MSKLNSITITIALVVSLFNNVAIATEEKSKHELLQGVWKVVSMRNLDTKKSTSVDNTHYMISREYLVSIGGKQDRPIIKKNFTTMNFEEMKSQLPAGGAFMHYKILNGQIHRVSIFAISEYFEGKTIITDFEVDAKNLIFRDNHWADGQMREWLMERIE